jgi:hypothetical protein
MAKNSPLPGSRWTMVNLDKGRNVKKAPPEGEALDKSSEY